MLCKEGEEKGSTFLRIISWGQGHEISLPLLLKSSQPLMLTPGPYLNPGICLLSNGGTVV